MFPALSTAITPPSPGRIFLCTTISAASWREIPLYSINAAMSWPTQCLEIQMDSIQFFFFLPSQNQQKKAATVTTRIKWVYLMNSSPFPVPEIAAK
jgi:hypothetical protein